MIRTFTVLAFTLFVLRPAFAVVVVEYETASSSVNATLSTSNEDASVDSDDMTAGSGLGTGTGSTWNWRSWDTASTSFDAAVIANDFWSWGFDVSSAVTVDNTA